MSGSVSMVDGHIDPDTNRMTAKESYPPLQYVDEDYNPIEITSKPTDKEIIQALECCKTPVGSGSCNDCPFDYQRKKRLTSTDKSCTTLMFDYALDLINRQQATIEKLNVELVGMRGACNSYKMHYDNAKAKIERLTINMNAFGLGMKQEKERADTIRAEAIKELAGKIADVFYSHDKGDTYVREVVYNLVKEMAGEQE